MDLADQHTILRHPWRPPNRVRLPLLHPYHAAKCSVQASFGHIPAAGPYLTTVERRSEPICPDCTSTWRRTRRTSSAENGLPR